MREFTVRVISQKALTKDIFLLNLKLEKPFKSLTPGQFFMIKIQDGFEPFLRRPLAWFSYDKNKKSIQFAYKVVGKGTTILAHKKTEEKLNILGPLGKGFSSYLKKEKLLFVAGGAGIFPFFSILENLSEKQKKNSKLIWGVNKKNDLFYINKLKNKLPIYLVTEDGSISKKALATDVVEKILSEDQNDWFIIACGPAEMLKNLANLLEKYKLNGELSMEERMACGFGACLGCAVPSKKGGYLRACKDGPVFRFDEIDWKRVK